MNQQLQTADVDKEQQVRRALYAHRNGIAADALRQAGDPHRFIMGCQLVDLMNIATQMGKDISLARKLWGDVNHRECRLIATMLYPEEQMGQDEALAWCLSVESIEMADVLCHRLLRHLEFAPHLIHQLLSQVEEMMRYVALRLLLNLLMMGREDPSQYWREIVEKESSVSTLSAMRSLLASLKEELALSYDS